MRCAECDCENGGDDCNWIKAGPMTNNTRDNLAKAIGFGGRCLHDVSSNADEFWGHSSKDTKQRYLKQADAAIDIIRDNITLEWRDFEGESISTCGCYQARLLNGGVIGRSTYRLVRASFGSQLIGDWRDSSEPEKALQAAKDAALEHYRNTIMSEIVG